MAYKIVYSKRAVEALKNLPPNISHRIIKKIHFFKQQKNPLSFAKRLQNSDFGQYRFRVGSYRVLFDLEREGKIRILFIITIRHRQEAYGK